MTTPRNPNQDSTDAAAWRRGIVELVTPTLELLRTEYPNGLRIDLSGPPDHNITPKGLHPAFYGCYDWHSSVHSHWQIARAMRMAPDDGLVPAGRALLDEHLSVEKLAIEMEWIADRPSFEMPYGMAWVLALCAEFRSWDGDEDAGRWLEALAPLEEHAAAGFLRYCSVMAEPMRGGLHNQSAFSLGLAYDWAIDSRNPAGDLAAEITDVGQRFFAADVEVGLAYEPSAADFLSPSLSEADLMRRLSSAADFGGWLNRFAPKGFDELAPVSVVDPSNGQFAHWAGLNLSRSWMLSTIAMALPAGDPRIPALEHNAQRHADAGLPMARHQEYMISHWVPTFAVYLLTEVHQPPTG